MDEIMRDFEMIFEILTGLREPEADARWVESIAVEGTAYENAHRLLWDCRVNLADRLNADIADKDISDILDAVMTIEREIARHMFRYGMECAQRNVET